VISEVTLTVLLLICAGLFLRSFLGILDVDPGFNPKKTLAFDVLFADDRYPGRRDRHGFLKDLCTRLNTIPGVESAAAAFALPLSGEGNSGVIERADRPDPIQDTADSESFYRAGRALVSENYFAATGIKLLHGRTITEADNRENAPRVMVINRRVAHDLFPDEDPLGKYIRLYGTQWEIVGIVESIRFSRLDADLQPRVYVPQIQNPGRASLIIRTAGEPLSLVGAVREAILAADPGLPIFNVRTLEQTVRNSVAKKRTTLILLGCLATVAVGLACIGLYGFMSYFVAQRTRELCIRAALGARRSDIIKQVVTVGMRLSAIGIAIGLSSTLALAHLVESQLFRIGVYDPAVYILSICLIGIVTLSSVYLPARRVAKVDPMEALRYE
jgi:predicted permease